MEAKVCLRVPIPEIEQAARLLDDAVSAHLAGDVDLAEELIALADMPIVREWTESIWAKSRSHLICRPSEAEVRTLSKHLREKSRMPTSAEKAELRARDGFHCRFCGIPLIRAEVRRHIRRAYPKALSWGRKNAEQHAAFQAMWMQYDHIVPHALGGNSDLDNLVVTCAPCNFGRMNYTLGEVGLIDPRDRPRVRSSWDGLERFKPPKR